MARLAGIERVAVNEIPRVHLIGEGELGSSRWQWLVVEEQPAPHLAEVARQVEHPWREPELCHLSIDPHAGASKGLVPEILHLDEIAHFQLGLLQVKKEVVIGDADSARFVRRVEDLEDNFLLVPDAKVGRRIRSASVDGQERELEAGGYKRARKRESTITVARLAQDFTGLSLLCE